MSTMRGKVYGLTKIDGTNMNSHEFASDTTPDNFNTIKHISTFDTEENK